MNTEFPRGRGPRGSAVKPPGTEDPGGGVKLEKTLPSRVLLQYCAKVMQTIIDEYRALFSRFIADISGKHRMDCRTLKR